MLLFPYSLQFEIHYDKLGRYKTIKETREKIQAYLVRAIKLTKISRHWIYMCERLQHQPSLYFGLTIFNYISHEQIHGNNQFNSLHRKPEAIELYLNSKNEINSNTSKYCYKYEWYFLTRNKKDINCFPQSSVSQILSSIVMNHEDL